MLEWSLICQNLMRLKDNGAKYRRLSCTSNPHTLTESQRTKEVLYVWPLITKSISSNITTIQYHCSHHLPKLAWSKQRFLCEPEDTRDVEKPCWDFCAYVECMSLHVQEPPQTHNTHTNRTYTPTFPAFTPRNEGSLLQPDLSI